MIFTNIDTFKKVGYEQMVREFCSSTHCLLKDKRTSALQAVDDLTCGNLKYKIEDHQDSFVKGYYYQ